MYSTVCLFSNATAYDYIKSSRHIIESYIISQMKALLVRFCIDLRFLLHTCILSIQNTTETNRWNLQRQEFGEKILLSARHPVPDNHISSGLNAHGWDLYSPFTMASGCPKPIWTNFSWSGLSFKLNLKIQEKNRCWGHFYFWQALMVSIISWLLLI